MAPKKPQPGQVVNLSPTLLEADPGQPRQTIDRPALEALKESIRAVGINIPLHVLPIAGGRYRVIAGMRRLTAATELELETVPAIIGVERTFAQHRIAQMVENSQRAGLTDLEKAQGLMVVWLAMQIEAFEKNAANAGETLPDSLTVFDPDATPATQITVLKARLCQLAGVESLDAYIGSGKKIQVPWQDVLQIIGEGTMEPRQRKRLLELLDLDPAIQDQLAGIPLNPKALKELQHMPPDAASALIEAAKATDNPADIIRDETAKNEKRRKKAQEEAESDLANDQSNGSSGDQPDADGGAGTPDDAEAEQTQTDTAQSNDQADGGGSNGGGGDYDLNDGPGMSRHKPPPSYTPEPSTRDIPKPKGGSTPPDQDGWDADSFSLLLSGLEAMDRGIELAGLQDLSEAQQKQIRSVWRSVIETLSRVGMELPERSRETDDIMWT